MSSIVVRSRVALSFLKPGRRFLSSDASSSMHPHKEPIVAARTLISDQPPPPEEPAPPSSEKKPWGPLTYGLVAALTGVTAAAGYATYAYSLEEIDEKTKAFRSSINSDMKDSDSAVDKFQGLLYSAAMTVPAKAIELYLDLRKVIEDQIQGYTEPTSDKLLPDLHPMEQHVFTLVLDLNETLVYSDWKRDRGWRTFKRPGVDAFLEHLGKFFEIVIYSDQLQMYVDPVVERLDGKQVIRYRLHRGATKYQDGKHYRDLSKLNRNPGKVIYVSGHARESCLQPENCIEIKPWKLETDDTTLLDLIPFLEFVATRQPADIRPVLESYGGTDIAQEFIKRSQEHQRLVHVSLELPLVGPVDFANAGTETDQKLVATLRVQTKMGRQQRVS